MSKINEQLIGIERRLEQINLQLIGMQNVLKYKGTYTPKEELKNIVFDMEKTIGDVEKLKKGLENH